MSWRWEGPAAVVFFAFFAASAVVAGPAEGPRTVTVNGDAEIRVVPDEVVLTVGVQSFNLDLNSAKSENDARVSGVLHAAEKHGIPGEHVQTEYLSIEPQYDQSYERRNFLGYLVRKTVVIRMREIDEFEPLLSSILVAGANYVHGIDFRTTELRKHRDRARALAIEAAREKAVALAAQLGEKVGRARSIQEGHSGWWSWYGAAWGSRWQGMAQNVVQMAPSSGGQAEGPTSPGQIAVHARVTVTFELIE
jgi:uncharacterized protein YggE